MNRLGLFAVVATALFGVSVVQAGDKSPDADLPEVAHNIFKPCYFNSWILPSVEGWSIDDVRFIEARRAKTNWDQKPTKDIAQLIECPLNYYRENRRLAIQMDPLDDYFIASEVHRNAIRWRDKPAEFAKK